MDDVANGHDRTRSRRAEAEPKMKYMNLLQEVADRKRPHILIDLDELDEVRASNVMCEIAVC